MSDALDDIGDGGRGYYPSVPSLLDLAIPPRLLMRALDDLHAIAEASRRLPTIEAMLTEQFEILNRQADELIRIGNDVIAMGREANAGLTEGVEVGRRLHERGEALLEAGERVLDQGRRIEEQAERILAQGKSMEDHAAQVDQRAVEMMEQSERVIEAAREVAVRGAEVAAALPALEQMAAATEPLQPAIERFSRMVDRLPGGKKLDEP